MISCDGYKYHFGSNASLTSHYEFLILNYSDIWKFASDLYPRSITIVNIK